MSLPEIGFLILSGLALFSAILVITQRSAVHSAIWLIVTLFSVGGVYLTLEAPFLFAVQVILYVGAIMVLFLFVVMLVNLDAAANQAQFSRRWALGLCTVVILLAELVYGFYAQSRRGFNLAPSFQQSAPAANTQAIGTVLYRTYMLPVEIASILLLVAMVGAIVMAKRKFE
jgi:NADH-quinone oxidoreductase subunit J